VSLKWRLALVFGLVGFVSVGAVSAIGYATTDHQLRGKVDDVIVNYATRLAAPDGQLAVAVCNRFVRPDLPSGGGSGSGSRGNDLAGSIVQCVDVPDPYTAAIVRDPTVSGVRTVRVGDRAYRAVVVRPSVGGTIQVARDAGEAEEVLATIRSGTIVLGVVVTALAMLAGWITAWGLTRPLGRLTVAAEEVSSSGRLDVGVPTTGTSETGRLARAFQRMLRSLEDSRERQQRLAQDAGHELRTPLTSLRTNIATLRRHPDMPEETKDQVLADLEVEVAEMSTMVEGLVALVADRVVDEAPTVVEVDALVGDAVERLRRRTGREVTTDLQPVVITGRRGQLGTAVDNLLDNAAKFSPSGTPIEVRLDPHRLEVRDHGTGIPGADLPFVFDRFHRSDAARALPGSGLGLSIVREAAETHGATVTAATHPAGGAVLTIWWPDPAAPTCAVQPKRDPQMPTKDTISPG